MGHPKLTEGALAIIMSGGNIDNPIMQVLGTKPITGHQEKQRFRLLVSDGKYQISFAMLTTQLNDKVTSGELSNFTVIKVNKYITSMIKNAGQTDKRVMVILELDVLMSGEEAGGRIGTPVSIPDDPSSVLKNNQSNGSSASTSNYNNKPTNSTSSISSSNKQNSSSNGPPPNKQNSTNDEQSIDIDNQLTFPISSLSPYQNKWVIKARVMNKSAIRSWSNSRGEGKLFSMDLIDESGEIRATVFRDLVDKYFDMIEIDKVYYMSKCIIKLANKQFNSLNNDYEMTFCNETIVQPCHDEVSVPKINYNFIPINQIGDREANDMIDIIGVCHNVTDVVTFISKNTSRELKKREVNLIDQSNTSVALTLWGNEAQNFDGTNNPIVAVRGAKVGEFGGGKNISVLMSSVMKINPDVPEAHRLRGWYDNNGKFEDISNISARSVGGIMVPWLSFREVKERKLGSGDRGDFYQCKATILLVNTNNCFYKACPSAECNKKVVDLKNGMYRCEKCNREYPEFKYRLIMSMNLADWSDNHWVNAFTAESEKILGKTSQEIGEAHEADEESLTNTCNQAHFNEYIFRCRAKNETFNDEVRLKTSVIKVEPINYKEYNAHLISQIKKLVGK